MAPAKEVIYRPYLSRQTSISSFSAKQYHTMQPTDETQNQFQEMLPSSHSRSLQVDFSWRKFESLITEKDGEKSKPLYILDCKMFRMKNNLVFKDAIDKSTIGTGTLHPISIHADCTIRGQKIKLEALKRWRTRYSHYSHAFSNTDTPVQMTWTANCGLKTWDFICLDQNQEPVAKFAANLWAVKKVGTIEFLGKRASMSEAAREELVVTGLTLIYCMVLRTNNILNFFGAIFAKTGNVEKGEQMELAEHEEHGVAARDARPVKNTTDLMVQ